MSYLTKLAHFQLDHEETCVNFTIERWYPVANMSRYLPLRVYDYYAPGKLCYSFCWTVSNSTLAIILIRFLLFHRTFQRDDIRLHPNVFAQHLRSVR